MPVPSLASFKVANGEVSSATKFNNLVQAVEDEFGSIQADQIPGGGAVGQFLRGDGWAGAYATYVPAWTSTGTAPSLGNAVIEARYLQIGKFVHYYFQVTFGSTSSFGTGAYRFSLPVAARAAGMRPAGIADLFRSSTNLFGNATAEFPTTSTVRFIFGATYFGAVTEVGQTSPWTWAQSDFIAANLVYEAA